MEASDIFSNILTLDQNPIGHTKRSDVCTYTDILTSLRTFFTSLPQAQLFGLAPRYFSFNHPKGMCSTCQGLGYQTVYLQYLPPVKIKCPECHGDRLVPISLKVKYKDKNLGQVLKLNIVEAKAFLPLIPKVHKILDCLISIGLGYLTLGQEIATLSGGEAQRLRLSRDLIKPTRGKSLYLFDEPTSGLHNEDIIKLLPIFYSLVDKGHTLIMIEHNVDMIVRSDYVIDLGPGAGDLGGEIVSQGTPAEIDSLTGKYIKKYLND